MMGLSRLSLLVMLLASLFPTRTLGQAAAPGGPPPGVSSAGTPAGPNAATASGVSPTVPQVVPTPPTQRPGPGSPAGSPDVGAEFGEAIPAPPPDPAVWTRQTIPVAPCVTPPKIDGRLDDPCWKTATHAVGFFRYGGGTPSQEQTEAWICADKTHLYVAFHCRDSRPGLIQESMTQRNGSLGNDDYVGLDIDSQGSRHGYSTFIVTARGTQSEQLEGGTADNITWAGDWTDATRRTRDGWACEIAIPFALLHYPRGAHAFGMVLSRKMSRETFLQGWPYIPPAGATGDTEAQYLAQFTGIAPPFYAPRPIFLPYTLATAGAGNSVREGMDIKYPLSTTLTGVATLYPDFQTIEQDVTTINFSYTEKLLTDRRPFFAEGNGFLPYRDLFYSRRITAVDGGLKVVGKEGDTTLGVLTTGTQGVDAQTASAVSVQHDLGLYSHVLLDVVDDIQRGQPSNQTAKFEGVYGWQAGQTRFALQADHMPSWAGGRVQGGKDYYQVSNTPPNGHPQFAVSYEDIAPNFISNLGFNPELDHKGEGVSINQFNQFAKGWVENYAAGASVSTFQYHSGGFFHNDLGTYAVISTRRGYSYELDTDTGRRDQADADTGRPDRFHDHTLTPNFGWNQKTLYQQGLVSDSFGRQAGQPYNFLSISQGLLITRPFSVQLNYSRLAQGGTHATQAIATGTYRLNADRTVGARLVNQAGADQGSGLGTDLYFSFSQQVRAGTDVFLLFGDPNSPKTRGKITLKLVRPF